MIDATRPRGYKGQQNAGNMGNVGNMGGAGQMNQQGMAQQGVGQQSMAQQSMRNMVNMPSMQSTSSAWQGSMVHGAVIGTRDNVNLISDKEFENYGLRVEIMEYEKLLGCTNVHTVQSLYFMSEANLRCRQIALYILNSGVKIEAGAMSYFQGPLQMKAGINNVGKFISQAFTSKLTNERLAMPEYTGSGILVLEPSFKHFLVLELQQGESIICDKGMFFAASLSVSIEPTFAGSASGSLLGGEGIFQQLITGPGVVILESSVPVEEINKIYLNNDILKVDGNFVLFRSGNINMSVETVSQSMVGSVLSGEGLVNVYRGTGDIWLAPTLKIYDALKYARSIGGDLSEIDFNTSTGKVKARTN